MKIRSNFVPNSSSSSFIVAFPKKPKNVLDVLKFMFDKNVTGSISSSCGEECFKKIDIAETVWNDICKNKKATPEEIAEKIYNRYYYSVCQGFNGGWSGKEGKWFGVDSKLLCQLMNLSLKQERDRTEECIKEREILKKSGLVMPSWKENETEKDKLERGKYYQELEAWKKSSKIWGKFNKDKTKRQNETHDKIDKLKKEIAKIDTEKFMQDNKNSFFSTFEYSDDSAYGATMEHGEIFHNLPHITVSNH